MPATDRPNLLLVCVDQWRADCLSAAGHPVVSTPHLDALAGQGVRYDSAYAACPSCIAARASLHTGLTPARHGFVGYRDGVTWQYPVTLAGTLAAGGYHTQCVGKMHVFPWRNLLGFHNVVLHDGYMHHQRRHSRELGAVDDYTPWLRERVGQAYADHNDTGLGCNGYAVRPWMYDTMLHPTAWVTTQGIDFLRRRDPGKPFFLMLSYHRPHPPLDPPAEYLDQYRDRPLPPLVTGDWVTHDLATHHGVDSPIPTDAASIDLARRAYFAQLTFIDHQLNRMLMALYEHDVLDQTAIVFHADHGDMLYDHRTCAKSVPFEGSARVPLIVRPPQAMGLGEGARGRTSSDLVELRDLFPTLCDFAGLPVPDGLDGRSLLPRLRDPSSDWRELLHGEHVAGPRSNQWLTDGREKYVWFCQTGRELLFDLHDDPRECHDLAATRPDRLAWFRARLVEELTGRPEGFVQDGGLVVGRPQSATLEHAGRGV